MWIGDYPSDQHGDMRDGFSETGGQVQSMGEAYITAESCKVFRICGKLLFGFLGS